MQYIFQEPDEYTFEDRDGHSGKIFPTTSTFSKHLIIECNEKLQVSLIQHEVEFSYYIIKGEGYFIIEDEKQLVTEGDLVVLPPGTKYTFGGRLKMLLVNTPQWHKDQEEIFPN